MASSPGPCPGKSPPEGSRLNLFETYEAFLRFNHHAAVIRPESFAGTLAVLEQAVQRDPESGLAWSLLAFLYGQSFSLTR